MPANVFIDTNIWIYSFIEAKEEQEKRQTVLALLEKLSQQSHYVFKTHFKQYNPLYFSSHSKILFHSSQNSASG